MMRIFSSRFRPFLSTRATLNPLSSFTSSSSPSPYSLTQKFFSATPSPHDSKKEGTSFLNQNKTQLTQIAIAGGVGITLYGLSSFMWDLTYGLINMTPFQSGYYGFLTGGITTATIGSMAYYGKRSSVIHPSGVLHKAVAQLNSSSDVRIAMGGYITSSKLAAFDSQYGTWTISSWKPKWQPARVEMIFKIRCKDTEGIATVIAIQKGLHSEIEFLGVDILNKDALRILVHGDRNNFSLHDALRTEVVFN